MVTLPELINELKTLRKGRGLLASRITERVGPELRGVCEVTDDDGPARIRGKVTERLTTLVNGLPVDLRLAVLAAFAITPEAQLPLYQDRIAWVAARLGRDPRTARRRIDDGIHQLAQLASISTREPGALALPATGWHTTELRIMLALDRLVPEAIEHRTIVSNEDGLAELDLAMTLNALARRPDPRPNGCKMTLFRGGQLVDRGMRSSECLAYALRLPKPLARGEAHDFMLRYRFADRKLIRPHLVCVPSYPCAVLDLRVRFGQDRPPARIWLLRHAFQRDIDDGMGEVGEALSTDPVGEIHVTLRDLTPGLAYGVRWECAPAPSNQLSSGGRD